MWAGSRQIDGPLNSRNEGPRPFSSFPADPVSKSLFWASFYGNFRRASIFSVVFGKTTRASRDEISGDTTNSRKYIIVLGHSHPLDYNRAAVAKNTK